MARYQAHNFDLTNYRMCCEIDILCTFDMEMELAFPFVTLFRFSEYGKNILYAQQSKCHVQSIQS